MAKLRILLALLPMALTACTTPITEVELGGPGKAGLQVTAMARQDRDVLKQERKRIDYSGFGEVNADLKRYGYRTMKNFVVYLRDSESNKNKPVDVTEIVFTADGNFQSALSTAVAGQTVRFRNNSHKIISLYGYDETHDRAYSDMPLVGAGKTQDWQVSDMGSIQLYVSEYVDAEAILFIAPGVRSAVLSSGKNVRFTGLKAGHYWVGGWHEVLPVREKKIQLTAGIMNEIEVLFSVDVLLSDHP